MRAHSQYEHPKHPPDKEYRDDGAGDVNDPIASCLWLTKIEHAAMVAGPGDVHRDPTHRPFEGRFTRSDLRIVGGSLLRIQAVKQLPQLVSSGTIQHPSRAQIG